MGTAMSRTVPVLMRPFFSYYGAKFRIAKKMYSVPEYDTIVEPFAGSAGYAMRYADRKIVLCDLDPIIFSVWAYLTRVSPQEILSIPDLGAEETVDDLLICQEAKWLIGFWVNRGAPRPRKIQSRWMREGMYPGSFWGERVRQAVASQLHRVKHWKIYHCDYRDCPVTGSATWFIDPPYQSTGGKYRYGPSCIDYEKLGAWCRSRHGQIIVCENMDASWLPFRSIGSVLTCANGVRSQEAVWLSTTKSILTPPSGCETYQLLDTSQRVRSTLDRLSTCAVKISSLTSRSTGSRESAPGRTHSGAPDGPMTAPYGPEAHRVSPSVKRDDEKEKAMNVTYGPIGFGSLKSAALAYSCSNKLRRKMASLGSSLFALTWKMRTTPYGRWIYARRASVRHTSDNDFTSWPSPTCQDAKGSAYAYNSGNHDSIALKLVGAARLTGQSDAHGSRDSEAILSSWPTPTSSLGTKGVRGEKGAILEATRSNGPDLAATADLAGWATPAAQEAGGTPERFLERKEEARSNGSKLGISITSLNLQAQLTSWATPSALDWKDGRASEETMARNSRPLNEQAVQLANWPTPQANEPSSMDRPSRASTGRTSEYLGRTALRADSGPTANGSLVATANTGPSSGGQLNPSLPRWLQGLPEAWDECAPIRSSPAKRSKKDPVTSSPERAEAGSSVDTETPSSLHLPPHS